MLELHCGAYRLPLDRPLIMGILNVTPDSFSDGGRYFQLQAALNQGHDLIAQGADILDIGGESTRPGAAPVSTSEELRRILPVVSGLAGAGVPLSVDTRHAAVMAAALEAGASMINDVHALQDPEALEVCIHSQCAICLMHAQGTPQTMQQAPHYADVSEEVAAFLALRAQAARAAGIGAQRIVLDPGFGFGKNLEHNLTLLRELGQLTQSGYPLLVGLSRKSMLGALGGGAPVDQRLPASIAGAVIALERGARILRVHDVAATQQALRLWQAVHLPPAPGPCTREVASQPAAHFPKAFA